MAIDNMQGKVTMTGKMNEGANIPKPANLSGMNKLFAKKKQEPQQPASAPVQQRVEQPAQSNLAEKVQNLTNEDKAVLSTVLSPSVSTVLSKVAPEIEPLLKQFTKDEENVVLPVSIVKNFASRKYPGTEQESIQSFVSDLAGQMEQKTTVPPDTQMVQAPESDVNYDAIDSDTMAIS